MLELADAGADDVVFDLGCGDGRILLTAVEEFGVKKAVGFELDPALCESARGELESRGLKGRVEVVNGDLFHADLSPATLVTLYLTTLVNERLRPKLEDELQEGARVVSHDFPIKSWETAKCDRPSHYAIGLRRIYLYRVPEAYRRAKQGPEIHGAKSWWSRALKALRA